MTRLTFDDICFKPACQLMDAIRRQEITALDLTETFIDRITRINPKINAYCTPTFELAREQAKQADQRVKRGE